MNHFLKSQVSFRDCVMHSYFLSKFDTALLLLLFCYAVVIILVDVYKRQTQYTYKTLSPSSSTIIFIYRKLPPPRSPNLFIYRYFIYVSTVDYYELLIRILSVSYTHLDVYKRQENTLVKKTLQVNYPFPSTDLHQKQQVLITLQFRDV